MSSSPQSVPRPARIRPLDTTPVVLRSGDGHRMPATLELVSLTGGLLSLPQPFARGAQVKLMFLTHAGPVLAPAEMLLPVSWQQQPFRFTSLAAPDQSRLRTTIEASLPPTEPQRAEEDWIEKYRAAVLQQGPPRRRILKTILTALTLSVVCLGSVFYFLSLSVK